MIRASDPPMNHRRKAAGLVHTVDGMPSSDSKNSVPFRWLIHARELDRMVRLVPYDTSFVNSSAARNEGQRIEEFANSGSTCPPAVERRRPRAGVIPGNHHDQAG